MPMNDAPVVRIKVALERSEVAPGESVRMTATVPKAANVKVVCISHDVTRIGRYDQGAQGLVNLEAKDYRVVDLSKTFDGLPSSLMSSHPWDFEIRTPHVKGTEFEFKPKRLGIYLIQTTWLLRADGRPITSNPVVLVVSVPAAQNAIKPEWLIEE
jgi:hypothetical protein